MKTRKIELKLVDFRALAFSGGGVCCETRCYFFLDGEERYFVHQVSELKAKKMEEKDILLLHSYLMLWVVGV